MSQLKLSEFRASQAGCELALLADIEARTCLLSAAVVELGQEQLNELCLQAAFCLNGMSARAERFSVLSHPTGHRVFIRISAHDPEALCLLFAPDARLEGVEKAALTFLAGALQEAQDV